MQSVKLIPHRLHMTWESTYMRRCKVAGFPSCSEQEGRAGIAKEPSAVEKPARYLGWRNLGLGEAMQCWGGVSDWSLGGAVDTQRRKDGETQSRGQDKRRAAQLGVGLGLGWGREEGEGTCQEEMTPGGICFLVSRTLLGETQLCYPQLVIDSMLESETFGQSR